MKAHVSSGLSISKHFTRFSFTPSRHGAFVGQLRPQTINCKYSSISTSLLLSSQKLYNRQTASPYPSSLRGYAAPRGRGRPKKGPSTGPSLYLQLCHSLGGDGGAIEFVVTIKDIFVLFGEWKRLIAGKVLSKLPQHIDKLDSESIFAILSDFRLSYVYHYHLGSKKVVHLSSVEINDYLDFGIWFGSQLLGIITYQYVHILQAQVKACKNPCTRAEWEHVADLAKRAYELLQQKLRDDIEHKKLWEEIVALLHQSVAWPKTEAVMSAVERKARINAAIAKYTQRIYA
ncbi:hypothetical protein EDD85DRAFT_956334 [Armillaria nabsnona]|nr:hypothetical protein EDD85DRAFT_956334 [Armillaria nabsnona]